MKPEFKPSESVFHLDNNHSEIPYPHYLSKVLPDSNRSYLNEMYLFAAFYNKIPNFIHETEIDCRKASQWFSNDYKPEITNHFYNKIHFKQLNRVEFDDLFYFLYDDLIVYFDTTNSIVRFLFRKTDIAKIENLISELKKFKEKRIPGKPSMAILVNSERGLSTKNLHLSKPSLALDLHYNDDFIPVHKTIVKRLSHSPNKGLVLLHGKPGTGKTSYIRYLISRVKKNVIFLPPNLASALTMPQLMPIIMDNPNSILVIEDAENCIVDRNKNGNSPVSAILNLTDGLLSDCLNIQIVCSFNTDISRVDSALMRKGRLIAMYEFKELEVEKANALSKKLGYNANFTAPMTLSAIYNQDEKEFQPTDRNSIGFKSVGLN